MNWEADYLDLCHNVIVHGLHGPSRVGHTYACLGKTLTVEVPEGRFPLLTTRRIFYKGVFGELAAFLDGSSFNFDFLRYGCKYWTKNAREFAEARGGKPAANVLTDDELMVGPIYGYQWRRFNGKPELDQLDNARRTIIDHPHSRQIVVSAWNPQQLDEMCLPPCHTHFQYHVHGGKLHCSVYLRSVDLCLGLPSDIVLYYALLILMAADTSLPVGALHFHFGNAHVYQAHVSEFHKQLTHEIAEPPKYTLDQPWNSRPYIDTFMPGMIAINDYRTTGEAKYELF